MTANDIPTGGLLAVLIVLITSILAPSWLSWWNSRVSKKEMQTNGGKSFRDDFNKLVETVNKQGAVQKNHTRILDKQNTQLTNIVNNQKEMQDRISTVEKDHLLVGFQLGVQAKDHITGEIPTTQEDIVDVSTNAVE
jgi:uncharacterized protein YktB (UPF0637 family)